MREGFRRFACNMRADLQRAAQEIEGSRGRMRYDTHVTAFFWVGLGVLAALAQFR